MERYTRKDAERAFARLMEATGHRKAEAYNDVGGWYLDYAACYGGFVVEEVLTEGGGITQPFGSQRRTARAFCDAVNFAVRAMESVQYDTARPSSWVDSARIAR